ncbi:streptomycin biosynthesis protein StrI [Arthroderma uncinatum]|uniref:streptomycin biosynthesis protein StrI n=1 Tax=Arthroderma uncinatum TaxID=74035 RepID=UPI00144ADAFD|nr:streptomycin biosynthesis protein StrI [Arthroderma uncinatum]KAF3491560.1 streptomycin biosynthesis protein StrI [Arthroderma uncinatum]
MSREPGPLRFLVIGAGQRGYAYGKAVTDATDGVIHAVAEPNDDSRQRFGRKYVWGDKPAAAGQEFKDWKDWLEWEKERRKLTYSSPSLCTGVDGVFICTLDESHLEIVQAIAPLNLHIMCEKPLALSLTDTLLASKAITDASPTSPLPSKIFSIGHVLRYSPHNQLLRKLLLTDRLIGDVISLEHTEPVGWSHFSHSFVRGNWRRETAAADGSLLTKCCHDIDFILWLLCSPPPGAPLDHPEHLPRTITSSGMLAQFNKANKPAAAGSSTNCVSCPIERDCIYSSVKIYNDKCLAKGKTGFPIRNVIPEIEDILSTDGMETAKDRLLGMLAEDYDTKTMRDEEIAARPWYGRCVYECDNSVCDDQFVTMSWGNDPLPQNDTGSGSTTTTSSPLGGRGAKLATLHMVAPTESQCVRRGRISGTLGEMTYDGETINIYTFETGEKKKYSIPPPPPEEAESHGGGDYGLTRTFVRAVDAVENKGWDVKKGQVEILGCTLEEAIRSHAVVFAAEEARRNEVVVRWDDWWAKKTAQLPN